MMVSSSARNPASCIHGRNARHIEKVVRVRNDRTLGHADGGLESWRFDEPRASSERIPRRSDRKTTRRAPPSAGTLT